MSGVTKKFPEKRPSKDNSNPCAQCGLHIEDPYLLDALQSSWHITCFCCEECGINLPDYYCENEGHAYCFDDYCKKFGFKCEKCHQCIIGPTMTAGSTRKYHPECFICMSCEIPIGEKDSYSLLDTGVLLCQDCYVVERNARNSTLSHDCRVVRMVKVLVTNSKPVKFKLDGLVPSDGKCSLKVQRLPEHLQPEQYGHLEKGDKILEINGVPIKNQDQSEINRLTSLSGTDYIHLTIERKCDHGKAIQKTRSVPVNPPMVTPPTPSHDVTDGPSPWGPPVPRRTRVSSYTSPRYRPTTIHVSTPTLGVVRPMTPQQPQKMKADVERRASLKISSEEMGPLQCFRHSDLEIGEVLGQGFFGRVLKITHKTTGQVMVMKEIVRCTDESKSSFLKEVTLLKALDHPNVLRFIGILFQPGKLLTLITEYAGGGTLRQKIKRLSETFEWSLRVQIARDIAAGMVYLHEQNVIHRDLNSKNCLLRKDMSAVVADFGLARHFQPANPHRQTWCGRRQKHNYDEPDYPKQATAPSPKHESRSSSNSSTPTKKGVKRRMTVVGSAFWMAPEMLNGEGYNESVDVFSYGIVLCELIGRVKSDPDQLPRKFDYSPDFDKFSTMVPDCPPVFFNLAIECCRMDPDRRPAFLPIQLGLEQLVTQTEEEMRDQPSSFFSLVLADSPAAPLSYNASFQHMLNIAGDNRPISR